MQSRRLWLLDRGHERLQLLTRVRLRDTLQVQWLRVLQPNEVAANRRCGPEGAPTSRTSPAPLAASSTIVGPFHT